MTSIVFKIMGSDSSNTIEVEKLPKSYQEMLELLKKTNSSLHYSKNNIVFCIDGKPYNKTCDSIIYPNVSSLRKNNKYFVVVLMQPINKKQTHNNWKADVRSTVEGYVLPGTNNTFVPENRLGGNSGVSLIFSEGTSIRDKDGNPIKISVQTVNGSSKINGYRNVTKD